MFVPIDVFTMEPGAQQKLTEPNILFLSDHLGYADGVIHGATTYFLNVLPALKQTGIPVTVCFLRDRHPVAERLEAAGIEPVFLNRGKWDLRALADLTALIRRNNVTLVHAAGMKGILLGRLAARRTGARFLAHLHDTNPLDPLTRALQRMFADWTDGCIGISKAVCEYAVSMMGVPRERVRLLYSALPLDRYVRLPEPDRTALRAEWKMDADERVVAVIGRLSEEKGHAPFLRGLAPWLEAHPGVRVMIIGGGPLEQDLQALTTALQIQGRVVFTGHRDDIPVLLNMVDVLVMPSIREGLGYAALEAMATGCSVAVFAVGGLPEIVQDEETGLVAPPGDMPQLIRQLDRLLNDDVLRTRLRESGLRHVQQFSVEKHVETLETIYRELLDGTFKGDTGVSPVSSGTEDV